MNIHILDNKSVIARQYATLVYSCPLGTRLKILSAYFGKPPSCPYRDVLSKVQTLCAGKTNNCLFYVSVSKLLDICSGTRKQLETKYKCEIGKCFSLGMYVV